MDEDKLLPVTVLHEFVDKLEALRIDYMLSESMAMMLYSVYRFTADIDIVIDLTEEESTKLIDFLEPDYYVPIMRSDGRPFPEQCSRSSTRKPRSR